MMSRLVCAVISLFCLGCNQHNPKATSRIFEGVGVSRDVAYGSHPLQKLDVYVPQEQSVKPLVIFVHGGGWDEGDKQDVVEILDAVPALTDAGFAVASVNYRLVSDLAVRHPAQLDDIKSAIGFITRNAASWKIDTNRVGLIGLSAGAQLSLLYAYTQNNSGQIKCVVDFYGPTDFTHPSVKDRPIAELVTNYLGEGYHQDSNLWRQTSPAQYAATAVPTLILQGGADDIVLSIQSTMLRDSLAAHGILYSYVRYPAAKHGFKGSDLEDGKRKTIDFLRTHLR